MRQAGIAGDGTGAVGLAVADLNHDGAVDLLVLKRNPPHEVYLNDRLWRYHPAPGLDALRNTAISAAVASDDDAHGQVSLYTTTPKGLQRWSPGADGEWRGSGLGADPLSRPSGPLAVADVDGSGRPSLLWSSPSGWSAVQEPGAALAAPFVSKGPTGPWCLAELESGHGPSVVAAPPGAPPVVWRPGPGRFPSIALSLSGRCVNADSMRSNASGVGVKIAARFGSHWAARDTYRAQSGPGQSDQPISIGLGGAAKADFVRFLWPEGLTQTELDLAAGRSYHIEETQRQTSSCPLIFAWDGKRFTFVTDCLGVGGIGFAVGPENMRPFARGKISCFPRACP